MDATLSQAQIADVREALLSTSSDALIDLIFRLNLGLPLTAGTSASIGTAVRLGWIRNDAQIQLTPIGWLVADPIREYRLWLDRERRIHGERDHSLLDPRRYADKAVLEVGSGFGCNLLSLARRVPGSFVGVEPVAIYRQFTPLLAEREGMAVPEVHAGSGERLPFPEASFDVALCYSSHQYMDVRQAIREMARVLRPGGQLQIIGNTLNAYGPQTARQLARRPSPSHLLAATRTMINTLGYQWLGRRVWPSFSAFSTASPVYPSQGAMRRWLSWAGLHVRHDLIQRVGDETCFVGDKPGTP